MDENAAGNARGVGRGCPGPRYLMGSLIREDEGVGRSGSGMTLGTVFIQQRGCQFLFQRFLALVFSASDGQWVLKGGASLLMRLAEARFSKDLDLLHLGELSSEEAIAELRDLTAPRDGDHLTFRIGDGLSYSRTNPVVEMTVDAYIGAMYDSFSIDLALELHLLAVPERVRPEPVVDVPGLKGLPEVVVYPLTDQVADKVCAMYELHGDLQSPSSRYRDLVDLVLIVSTCEFDAEPVFKACARSQCGETCNSPRTWFPRGCSGPAATALLRVRPG